MIILAIVSIVFLLFVAPLLWALLAAIAEVYDWRSDKVSAKALRSKLGRDIYKDGPLSWRVRNALVKATNPVSSRLVGLLFWA